MCLMPSLVLALGISSMVAAKQPTLCVIPRPASAEMCEGTFTVDPQTTILVEPGHPELDRIGQWLADFLRYATGYQLTVDSSPGRDASGAAILLRLVDNEKALGEEGYRLTVAANRVTICGRRPAGVFYGVQTLRQLLPPEIEAPQPVTGVAWTVPCVRIEDFNITGCSISI